MAELRDHLKTDKRHQLFQLMDVWVMLIIYAAYSHGVHVGKAQGELDTLRAKQTAAKVSE